jgi:hypothetical protein
MCVGVTLAENISGVFEVARVTERFSRQNIALAYSGRVFAEHPELQRRVPGVYLGTDLQEAIARVDAIGEEIDRERWLSIASTNHAPHSLFPPSF